jgi:1-deoxyxylulose-5-phosphate synthase
MQHLDEAIQALDLNLSPEEIKALKGPYVPHPVLGHQ